MMQEVVSGNSSSLPFDIASHLPLQLVNYQIIPPAPFRSESGVAVDFLWDFAGYSWIAYGASSLLVITHFPNPLLKEEAKIGPIHHQVLELSREVSSYVSAVSWSPASTSMGELAVAFGDRIELITYCEDEDSSSSFCWSQTTTLVQSAKVEAIKWTGSGDGIISGGIEVMMWRRKGKSWEIAWSFKPSVPQTLVSTSWSSDGLSAAAPCCKLQAGGVYSPTDEAIKCVFVCQGAGPSQYSQAELHHPMPISMIQWRPSTGKVSTRHGRHAHRPVLLTCCLDEAVRLWGEVDDGRIRKAGKDNCDQKAPQLSFCVIGVIEVNQSLNGFLGLDVSVGWAIEVEGVAIIDDEGCYFSHLDGCQNDSTGKCEWLIAFGPKTKTTFWAVHCLDDFAPVRFPRITLWNKLDLDNSEMEGGHLLIHKLLMMRNRDSGPPTVCSLVQLLPCNSLAWTLLYSHESTGVEGTSPHFRNTENPLIGCAKGFLEVDGHTGKILEVAVHPFPFEVELAVSLDGNNTVHFWSFSSFFNSHIAVPLSSPSWKLCGKNSLSDLSSNYMCLCWALIFLGRGRVLLMGHTNGIDCFAVNNVTDGVGGVTLVKLFSVPFGIGVHGRRLSKVCSIPLLSKCNKNIISSKFLLVALWMEDFQALSWEITFHHYDTQGSCDEHVQTFEIEVSGEKYSVSVDPASSVFPAPDNDDIVTSCTVVCPRDLVLFAEQKQSFSDEMKRCSYAYHMITGSNNGNLKLWRSMSVQSVKSDNTNWGLVGVLTSGQGPILAISSSACCQKIATASPTNQLNYSSTVCIWECMHLESAGGFLLGDKLYFNGKVVALNWQRLGNGQLLLGVCLQNELRIYTTRRHGGQFILKGEEQLGGNSWVCIALSSALPAISDFLWGPKGTAVVVHDEHFSLFSNFLSLAKTTGLKKHMLSPSVPNPYVKGDSKSNLNVDNQWMYNLLTRMHFWSISDIAEIIGGSLPLFHPEALLINLFSGNWKRAFISLHHLVKQLASENLSKQGYGRKLPNHIISSIPLSNYLEGLLSTGSSDKLFQWSSSPFQIGLSQFTSIGGYDDPPTSSSLSSEFNDFSDAIEKLYDYAYLTEVEKMQALALIDLLQEVRSSQSTSAYGGLDESARRFWVAVRYQRLYFARRFNRLPVADEVVVSSELVGWAFQSDCYDNLFDSLLSTEPSWEEMRSMGVGFWYMNVNQLRVKMERLARQRYMKHRDPKACTLLYIALNRLQVLAGLFKISKDDKDKLLATFLSRNFQEDKNKAAALKNAYVLMGKHQLELAIAFFLLGGDASSAVTICAKNLGDEQLALVICRLVEGCGGPLEHHLISKALLPSALSKGDSWMASSLEWLLGNYSQSFLRMLDVEMSSEVNVSAVPLSHSSFLDPSIGQYCSVLATKTSMKNAIGESNAAVLSRWATLMTIASFSRCGLNLEALDCLLSSFSHFGGTTHEVQMHSSTFNLFDMAKPSVHKSSSNWISNDMSCHFISHYKLQLAMQYLSNVLREHPSYAGTNEILSGQCTNLEVDNKGFEKLLKEFHDNLAAVISYLQQRFSLIPQDLLSMIVLHLHHNGLEFIAHYILQEYMSDFLPQEKYNGPVNLFPCPSNLLPKATEEISSIYVKYVLASCRNCLSSTYLTRNNRADEGRFCRLAAWGISNQGVSWSFRHLKAMLQLFLTPSSGNLLKLIFTILDLYEYHVLFASAWLQKNSRALLLAVIVSTSKGTESNEIKMTDLTKLIAEIVELLAHNSSCVELIAHDEINGPQQEQSLEVATYKICEIMPTLWMHMSEFLRHQLSTFSEVLKKSYSSQSVSASKHNNNQIETVSNNLIDFLKLTCTYVSSYCSKQLATYQLQLVKVSNKINYLEDDLSHPGTVDNYEMSGNTNLLDNGRSSSDFKQLWDTCVDLKASQGVLSQEYKNWPSNYNRKSSSGWSDAYMNISREFESEESCDKEDRVGSPSHSSGSPLTCLSPDDHPFKSSSDKDLYDSNKVLPFLNPKDIYKRNGELLEALCINSTDQCQAVLASNRKGIIFFNWNDEVALHRGKSEYIWERADWPHDGWAHSEAVPFSTCVSPDVGLGNKNDLHLRLGGSTLGVGALVRSVGDLKGGGAIGVPGYAGAGAYSLGWGIQEAFDEYHDPPATVESIKTGAFASHPLRSFFLVGSSNTHIYLWEFGKDVATATYGVLPAANVSPPYAVASVSSLRFDHCGHRFVSGALDGTVSTWQLEVGGRSNIQPTESSRCFDNHTADVTYVTASGSIVAAAGYSSKGVNIVVWDTLAPPSTSQASIMCHEGGARSLSVFDNDIGSGSISPLILTGGKGGDVGLHDFRYIATGRTKKHKHLDTGEHGMNASTAVDMRSKTGDQNRNGMLWYIPKAHSGSITKICTIPNSSFFLTGSKDGDVKLWDAKRAKLVYHWPRLHEKHTFLQPTSRGFGGVVRAAVTDIHAVSNGFLTCGGDGVVKFVGFQDYSSTKTN